MPSPREQKRPRTRAERIIRLCDALNEGKPRGATIRFDRTIPFGPRLELDRFSLGTGLTVLAVLDRAAPVVAVQLWVGVGSRHEKEGKTGLAHLFEHLMFGESDGALGSFDRVLEEAGANTNAETSPDWTSYRTVLPREALDLAMKLEAQRLAGLELSAEQLEREREIVRHERRQRVDGALDGSARESLFKEAFREHAYRHPTIGWQADLAGLTLDDCQRFHEAHYGASNAALVVVGDYDLEELLTLAQQCFGRLSIAQRPLEDVRPEAPQLDERWVTVFKPTPVERAVVGYRAPALGDFDHAPLTVLSEILFGGSFSRTHRALILERHFASDVRARLESFRDPSLLTVFVTARGRTRIGFVLHEIETVIDGVRWEAVSRAEIETAVMQLELDFFKDLETLSGKAERVGFFHTVLGDPAALLHRIDAIRRVGPSDVLRVARQYLKRQTRTVIEILPTELEGTIPPRGAA
jgi:zinc protease